MRPNATRIESFGSVWWIDEEAHEYLRIPSREAPRELPEWSDERAGPLQDAVWHSFDSWELKNDRLFIYIGKRWISAPTL